MVIDVAKFEDIQVHAHEYALIHDSIFDCGHIDGVRGQVS